MWGSKKSKNSCCVPHSQTAGPFGNDESLATSSATGDYVYWDTHLIGCYHKARPSAVAVNLSGERLKFTKDITVLQRTLRPEAIEELIRADEKVTVGHSDYGLGHLIAALSTGITRGDESAAVGVGPHRAPRSLAPQTNSEPKAGPQRPRHGAASETLAQPPSPVSCIAASTLDLTAMIAVAAPGMGE